MKRTMSIISCIAFVAIALLFTSCDKTENNQSHIEGQVRTLTASTEKSPETKTQVGGENNVEVHWTNGDKVRIYCGNQCSEFTATATENPMVAELTGNISGVLTSAVYPASMAHIGQENHITIPASQTYVAGNVSNGVMPMAAPINPEDGDLVGLKNLCGILKLQLTGSEIIKTIDFISTNYVAGSSTIFFGTDGIPFLLPFSEYMSNIITLDCGADGVQLSGTVATPFHIVVPPTTTNQFTIKVTTVDGKVMTRTTQAHDSNLILRNTITTMAEIAFVEDFIPVKVGDFYYNDGTYSTVKLEGRDADVIGIVFQVIGDAATAKNGKIVSLDQAPLGTEICFRYSDLSQVSNDNHDGRLNMLAHWNYAFSGLGDDELGNITKTAGNFDYCPLLVWANDKNVVKYGTFDPETGYANTAKHVWYIPARNELSLINTWTPFELNPSLEQLAEATTIGVPEGETMIIYASSTDLGPDGGNEGTMSGLYYFGTGSPSFTRVTKTGTYASGRAIMEF